MDTEKKIRIGVDNASSKSGFDNIKRDANEMSKSIIEDALKVGHTWKEVKNNIEDAIKAMERAGTMDTYERKHLVREQVERGDISESRGKEKLEDISNKSSDTKLQNELLRDIIDAILKTGNKEIEENKKQTIDTLSKTPHAERTLMQRYQAARLGMEGESLNEEESRGGKFAGGMRGAGMAIIGARDPISAGMNVGMEAGGGLMAMGGSAGLVGAAVILGSVLGKKAWDASASYYKAAGLSQAVSGQAVDFEKAKGFDVFGESAIDYASRLAPLMQARRSSVGIDDAVYNQIIAEKGLGIDRGMYNSAEQLARLHGGTAMSDIQSGIAGMRSAGIVKGEDMAAVPDYLQIMIGLGKDQAAKLGKLDAGINTKVVAELGGMNEALRKSPEYLSNMVDAVKGGLTGASSPQTEALQMMVLSKIRPGASLVDLQMMRENPFSKENQAYLPSLIGQYDKLSGGNTERLTMLLKQAFPQLSSWQAAKDLVTGYKESKLGKFTTGEGYEGQEGVKDLDKRAREAANISGQPKAIADYENTMITLGKDVVVTLKEIATDLKYPVPTQGPIKLSKGYWIVPGKD